ncbi:MAG TPA: hypothetical protein VM285_05690 [Polyangia bacterium]|nr:hypothetical protein [Polyangia bacterium]
MQTHWMTPGRRVRQLPTCSSWCQHYERDRLTAFGEIAEGVAFGYDLVYDGGIFGLYPLRSTTPEQIEKAKAALQRDRDVVGRIRVHEPEPPCSACGRAGA